MLGDHPPGLAVVHNKNVQESMTWVKNEKLGVSREEYGAYRMDSADERQGRQVYEDSTSLG